MSLNNLIDYLFFEWYCHRCSKINIYFLTYYVWHEILLQIYICCFMFARSMDFLIKFGRLRTGNYLYLFLSNSVCHSHPHLPMPHSPICSPRSHLPLRQHVCAGHFHVSACRSRPRPRLPHCLWADGMNASLCHYHPNLRLRHHLCTALTDAFEYDSVWCSRLRLCLPLAFTSPFAHRPR